MAFYIGIKSDLDKLTQAFDKMSSNQIPFATSLTLNRLAQISKQKLYEQMRAQFDRPTPWVLNSLYIIPSTKTKLSATVEHREFAGKGVPASKSLKAEIEGGERRQKKSEKALSAKIGGRKVYYVPSRYAPRDRFGNVSGSVIVDILSKVQALGEQGYKGNKTAKSRARVGAKLKDYFIMGANSRGLKPGVYQRLKTRSIPILFFVNAPRYMVRYPMQSIVDGILSREFDRQFAASMEYALATAKINIR